MTTLLDQLLHGTDEAPGVSPAIDAVVDMSVDELNDEMEESDLLAQRYETGGGFLLESARRRWFASLIKTVLRGETITLDQAAQLAWEAADETLRVER